MTPAIWTIMHVDDEAKHRDNIHELLHGEDLGLGEIKVLSLSSFEEATRRLAAGEGDLVVLDLVEGTGGAPDGGAETAGQAAFERIRAARFVPVVFYTGWGHQLTELADALPLVEVVAKGAGGIEGVNTAVQRFFNEGLPQLNRSLAFHVDEVQRVWGGSGWPSTGRSCASTQTLSTALTWSLVVWHVRCPVRRSPSSQRSSAGNPHRRTPRAYIRCASTSCPR